jgi:hypothetical protein
MENNSINQIIRKVGVSFLLFIILLLIIFMLKSPVDVSAIPQGASITYNLTENATTRPADSHTAAGGSFTTLILNVTSQTSKWKAYVGNVTGKLTLDNSNNKTIYDWTLTSVQGEVYVSRNNSVSFTSLTCANNGNMTTEDIYLGINSSDDDSINKTFYQKIHRSFVIGGTGTIQNSTCYAIATYINDTTQPASENATFQEVLLSDGKNLVFTSLLNAKKQGFDQNLYDFQLIAPDNPTEVATTYYFYAELG